MILVLVVVLVIFLLCIELLGWMIVVIFVVVNVFRLLGKGKNVFEVVIVL